MTSHPVQPPPPFVITRDRQSLSFRDPSFSLLVRVLYNYLHQREYYASAI